VSSKLGRPLGRPRWRASLLGHPGTSPERGGPVFLLPPAPPPPRTALGCGGLLTLTLRGKAMDGFEEQQERNRPQLCPPSLGNRRTDAGFPQASTGRRRSVAGRSLGLSLSQRTEHTIDTSQTLATQATRPVTYPPAKPGALGWEPLKAADELRPCCALFLATLANPDPRFAAVIRRSNSRGCSPSAHRPCEFESQWVVPQRQNPGTVKLLLPPRQSRGVSRLR